MFPLFLNMTDRLGVVIGGGAVGRRKAAALLEGGARVRLVCLEPRPAEETSAQLDWITASYRLEHLHDAALVLAAAPPTINCRVVADAHTLGLWVNAADSPEACDFFVPACLRRGAFLIAVGTGGAAPQLAQAVRAQLETQFDEAFGQWVELLGELRPLILEQVHEAERRRALFLRLSDGSWLERLRNEGVDKVRAAMRTLAAIGNDVL